MNKIDKWLDQVVDRISKKFAFFLFDQLKNHFVIKSWEDVRTQARKYSLEIVEVKVAETSITYEEMVLNKLTNQNERTN